MLSDCSSCFETSMGFSVKTHHFTSIELNKSNQIKVNNLLGNPMGYWRMRKRCNVFFGENSTQVKLNIAHDIRHQHSNHVINHSWILCIKSIINHITHEAKTRTYFQWFTFDIEFVLMLKVLESSNPNNQAGQMYHTNAPINLASFSVRQSNAMDIN